MPTICLFNKLQKPSLSFINIGKHIDPYGKQRADFVKLGQPIYVYGVIKYINIITKDIKYYEFAIKKGYSLQGFKYLWNENVR